MKLSHLTALFATALLLMLAVNSLFTLLAWDAHSQLSTAQERRQRALVLVQTLRQESELLGRLVALYINSGEPRFLLYYYDILGIREGDKPALAAANPIVYWERVIAGELEHRAPEVGRRESLQKRMRTLGFEDRELAALDRVLAASEALKEFEQIAFAATQGLYDAVNKEFVSDGMPDRAYARELIDSREYNRLRLRLSEAIEDLLVLVDQRTSDDMTIARKRLQSWIWASGIGFMFMILLVGVGIHILNRHVLYPVGRLRSTAGLLAEGRYAARVGHLNGVEELEVLGAILDDMARAISADIEQREEIQRELEQARQRAEAATLAKSRFLANMSHEIRTPMNAVIGMIHLALDTELTSPQRDYLSKAKSAARSLLGIIDDILDFSKIEAGRMELHPIPFQLEQIIDEALLVVQQRAQEKRIELLFDASDRQRVRKHGGLVGDSMRLRQILINLLSNAVKFTPSGWVRLRVESVGEGQSDCQWRFSVEDAGIGMSQEQLARLFQEFSQADGSTTREHGGTGLGLVISKRLVEMMGGTLEVESRLGAGSVFRFVVGFAPRIIALGDDRQPAGTDPPSLPERALQGMRILLVEDNPLNQQLAVELLEKQGVRVDVAVHGEQAITRLSERPEDHYAVVLMDLQMPVLDGYETTVRLRSQPRYDSLPIVAMTAHAMSEERQRGLDLGMQDYLAKPFEPRELYAVLARYRPAATDDPETSLLLTPPIGESLDRPPEIPGLDARQGLKCTGDSLDLYRRLLGQFHRQYLDIAPTFRNALESGDWEQTRRIAHTLRGLGNTLGMHEIATAAAALEQASMARDAPVACERLERLLECLDPMLEHLGGMESSAHNVHATASGSRDGDKSSDLVALLVRLGRLLTEGDIEALDLWREQGERFAQLFTEDRLERIEQALDSFDFETALSLLPERSMEETGN